MHRAHLSVAVAALLLAALAVRPAAAQRLAEPPESDLALVSVNALIGAASAGVVALIRGEDVTDALAAGALGGAMSFGGRRLAVVDVPAAGLLGRQIAAIGHGLVVDGGRGAPLLSEIWLPVGPAQVRVPSPRADGVGGWDARLDLMSTGAIVYAAVQPEFEVDWSASASTGSPVFRAPRHRMYVDEKQVGGVALLGTVMLAANANDAMLDHEVVHVIQTDFIATAWSYPAEDWLRGLVGADQPWMNRFVIGAAAPLTGGLIYLATGEVPFVQKWMETEAYSLARHRNEASGRLRPIAGP